MKDFRDLKVWLAAHQLTLGIYRKTETFPREERYGLVGQLRRAAVSIPANIAEGCGRRGDREFARFLQIAMGSASELEYLLVLSLDLGWIFETDHQSLTSETIDVKRMLAGLLRKLTADSCVSGLTPAGSRTSGSPASSRDTQLGFPEQNRR
jgi:four helix bundle protein